MRGFFYCLLPNYQAFSLRIPPVPPATPLSNTSAVGLVTPSGVWEPVLMSEPWYCVPELPVVELLPPRFPPLDAEPFLATLAPDDLLADASPRLLRLADEPPFLAPVDFFAAAFLGAAFFAPPFLAPPFLAPPFLAPPFFEVAFLKADFFAPPFLAPPFFAAFDLPEEPPLDDELRRDDFFDAPFLDAPFEEDLPPELFLADFFFAAFLVDFAMFEEI